jgi:predicted Holliday junction resolvase-like endonuclease
MIDPVVAILVVALIIALLVVARLLLYRASHPWTSGDLEQARQQSLAQSHATVTGKVQEHLASLFPDFDYNPRDARFLGTPVDFVVFDGLDEGEVREIVFVEVKTNRANLTHRERLVRAAVETKQVGWRVMRLPGQAAAENDKPG